jgi:hypothetical protein
MTPEQFDVAYRGFRKRSPFRPFLIEFNSGNQALVPHPESVADVAGLYTLRSPEWRLRLFAADSVARLLERPAASQ